MLRIIPALTATLLLLPASGAVALTISNSSSFLVTGIACAAENLRSNCQLFGGTLAVLMPPSDEGTGMVFDSSASASATASMTASLLFSSTSISFAASATASAQVSNSAARARASIRIYPLGLYGVELLLDPGEVLAISASGVGDGEWLFSIRGAGVGVECGTQGGPCPELLENTGLTPWFLGVSFEYELRADAGFGYEPALRSGSGSATVTLSLVPGPDLLPLVSSLTIAAALGRRRISGTPPPA